MSPRLPSLRVVLVGDYPPPAGGIAIHVQQLHRLLSHAGVPSFVVDIGKEARPVPDVFPVRDVARWMRRFLAREAERTVIHLHTSGNNRKAWRVAGAVGTLARLAGARAVLTLHSGLLPGFLAARASHARTARRVCARYDAVVAVSPALVSALAAAGVGERKLSCCPAFCASEVRPGAPSRLFEAVRARRSPLLAMAHHPSPVYGRRLMFEALARLRAAHPNIGLALFGPGTGDGLDGAAEVLRDAQACGVTDLIDGLGPVDHAEALAVIAGADAFVRPTTADGDAISVREALTLGVACVASDVSTRPRGTYLFKGGDAGALAERISEAVAMGPRGAEQVDAGPFLLALYRGLCPDVRATAPAATPT